MDHKKEIFTKRPIKPSDLNVFRAEVLDEGGIKIYFPTVSRVEDKLMKYDIYRTSVKSNLPNPKPTKPLLPVPIVENYSGTSYIDASENLTKGKTYIYAIKVKKGSETAQTANFEVPYKGKTPGDFTFTITPRADERRVDVQIEPASHACSYSVRYSYNLSDLSSSEPLQLIATEPSANTNQNFYVDKNKDMVVEVCAQNHWGTNSKKEIFHYASAYLPKVQYHLEFDPKYKAGHVTYDYNPKAIRYEEFSGANTTSSIKKSVIVNKGDYRFTDQNMKPNGNYYFALDAINCWGPEPNTRSVYALHGIPNYVPHSPVVTSAKYNESSNNLYKHEIKWEAVENAIEYKIACYKSGDADHPIYSCTTANTSVIFVTHDQGSYFYIEAINEWGKSQNKQHYIKK